ncbi:MAG: hypothetical protein U0X20_15555 [Caldilineaceae bacterium]
MKPQDQASPSLPTGTTLYHFNGVPVVAQSSFWPLLTLVTGFLIWGARQRNRKRSWMQCVGLGMLALPVALCAEVGHAMAHTVSARAAGAPMDEILLSAGMARTLYLNNDVAPRTHIRRSLGGPVFSLAGFLLSLLWWRTAPKGTINRDLAGVSLFGHSVILFGSVMPLPMIDGGIIMKWKLVETGQSPEQAEQTVRNTSVGLGATAVGLGVMLGFVRKRRWIGGLLAAAGAAGIAAGIGWLN